MVLKGLVFWSHLPFLYASLLFKVSYVPDKLHCIPFPTCDLDLPSSEVLHMCSGLKSDLSIRASLTISTLTEPPGSPGRNVTGFSDFPQYSVLFLLSFLSRLLCAAGRILIP